MIDVKGRRCVVLNCTKIAGYGMEGHPPSACLMHREPGMLDMKQHRQRLGAGKNGSINVKLGGAGAIDGSSSSFASKWGKRNRKGALGISSGAIGNGGVDGTAPAPAAVLDSHLDLVRPARRSTSSSFQHWYSDPGYATSMSNQSGGPAMRSWVMGASQPMGGSVGAGVPTVGMWAFNSQTSGPVSPRGSLSSVGESGSGHHQAPPHWAAAQENNAGTDTGNGASHYPGPHESGVLPALAARNCSSLPTLSGAGISGGRFVGGSNYGGDGGAHIGGGGGGGSASADGWRSSVSGPHVFGDAFQQQQQQQQQFSGVSSGSMNQHGYGLLSSSLGVGGGGGSNSGGGVDGGPSVKTEHAPPAEITMPDVESEDIWVRDLMQGAIARENGSQHASGGGSGGPGLDMAHTSSGSVGGMGSGGLQRSMASHSAHPGGAQQYPRHLVLAPPEEHAPVRSGTPSSMQGEDRRSVHQGQHRPKQHHQRQPSAGGGGGTNPQLSRLLPTPQSDCSSLVMGSSRSKGVSGPMGRSPSTASSGASPPHDSGDNSTDAMPRRPSGKHDGVGGGASSSAGGGGGNPGVGSDGGIARAGRGGAPALNHLFMNLSAAAGYDGGGHGMGLNPEMPFLPASRVASPTWGGV